MDQETRNAARGFALGCALGLVLWGVLALTAWAWW